MVTIHQVVLYYVIVIKDYSNCQRFYDLLLFEFDTNNKLSRVFIEHSENSIAYILTGRFLI